MSSSINSQPTDETPILHIDSATFQVAVIAPVTAVMTLFHSNNPGDGKNRINTSDRSNNQGNQWTPTHEGTLTYKPNSKKWILWDKKKWKSSQGSAKRQQPVAAFAAMTSVAPTTVSTSIPVTSIPARQYVGNLPKCKKCSFHHLGVCRKFHCKDCNKNGHTTHFCRTQI